LITIGTPHLGSQLATTLVLNQTQSIVSTNPFVNLLCLVPFCELGNALGVLGKPVGAGGVQSLEPGSTPLRALTPSSAFSALVGQAPTNPASTTENLLNLLIKAFIPGWSVARILGEPNDTIVPASSQQPGGSVAGQTDAATGQTDTVTISGVVHASLCDDVISALTNCSDTGETQPFGHRHTTGSLGGRGQYLRQATLYRVPYARPERHRRRRRLPHRPCST
jgi:hypothetical protein